MKIYNKGRRQYTFLNEKGETEILFSQKIKDIPQKESERLLKGYPRELINAKDFDDSKQAKIDKGTLDKINKENAILKERIKQLEEEKKKAEDSKEEDEDNEDENDDSKKDKK